MAPNDKDFAWEALNGFFRRRGEAGKFYCEACLVARLSQRSVGAFPRAAVQAAVADAFERPARCAWNSADRARLARGGDAASGPHAQQDHRRRHDVQPGGITAPRAHRGRALDRGRAAPAHVGRVAAAGGDPGRRCPAGADVPALPLAPALSGQRHASLITPVRVNVSAPPESSTEARCIAEACYGAGGRRGSAGAMVPARWPARMLPNSGESHGDPFAVLRCQR